LFPAVESNLIFQFPQQNACHHKEILKRGHFVMPNQLIFEGDAEECRKDIIFFAPAACMALPVDYIAMDSCLLPSCSYLFTVYH